MKRKIIYIIIVCLVAIFVTSCKKDKSDGNPDFSGICYITDLGISKIIYISTNKIRYMINWYGMEDADTLFSFIYNTQGKIGVIDYMLGYSPTERDSLFYDAAGRVAYIKKYTDGHHEGMATYHYNDANQIISLDLSGDMMKKYSISAKLVSGTVIYEYNAEGNVIKETLTSGGSIVSGLEYEYDNMRNPYREWNLPERLGNISLSKLMSKNNYVREKYYSSGSTKTTAAYTYNSNGYPSTMVITDEDGSESYGVQYFCFQ